MTIQRCAYPSSSVPPLLAEVPHSDARLRLKELPSKLAVFAVVCLTVRCIKGPDMDAHVCVDGAASVQSECLIVAKGADGTATYKGDYRQVVDTHTWA